MAHRFRSPLLVLTASCVTAFMAVSGTGVASAGTDSTPALSVVSQGVVEAVVAGRIVNRGTGAPVRTSVKLYDLATKRFVAVSSGADGRYQFAGVTAGRYIVRAGVSQSDTLPTFFGGTVHWAAAKVVTVTRSASYARDIGLFPAAVVTGRVLKADGTPVAGTDLIGANKTRYGTAYATTDAAGRYRLTGLASGDVVIGFRQDVLSPLVTARAVQGSAVEAPALRLLVAQAEGEITGRITGWDPDATMVSARELATGWDLPVDVAADGSVHGVVLRPGRYRIVLSGVNTASDVFTAPAGGTADFGTLAAPRQSTTVKGRVVFANGALCKRCTLHITDSFGTDFAAARTSSTGRYVARGANAGRYLITIKHGRRPGASQWDMVTRRSFTVKPGAASLTKNVRLNEGYVLSGQVVYRGKPVWNVQILPGPTLGVMSRTTKPTGAFRFLHIPSGKHRLTLVEKVVGGYQTRVATVTITGRSRSGVVLDLARLPIA